VWYSRSGTASSGLVESCADRTVTQLLNAWDSRQDLRRIAGAGKAMPAALAEELARDVDVYWAVKSDLLPDDVPVGS
jgi:hypothetical protein